MTSGPGSDRKRIGLLGGSFDPVHLGHLGMAEAALEAAGLDEVIFLPCFVSPFKESTRATGAQRHEMLKLAIVGEKYGWASISTYELERPGPSYSWQTAEHFSRTQSDVEWHWIAGTDQWNQIGQWANPERLRELLHFVILSREGDPVCDREGWRFTAVPFDHPASSTAIRADPGARRSWLPDGVYEYIRRHGLYGASEMTE